MIDEATQASTADLAMLFEAARVAGARVVLVGDTQQLGSPEAGGMFRLLAKEVPAAELTEVRRFRPNGKQTPPYGCASGSLA